MVPSGKCKCDDYEDEDDEYYELVLCPCRLSPASSFCLTHILILSFLRPCVVVCRYNCDIVAVQLSSNSFLAKCQTFSNSAGPSLRYCPSSLTTSLNPILYPASTTLFTNTSFEDLELLDGQEQRRLQDDPAAPAPPVSATESSIPPCSCDPPDTSTFLEIYNAAINDQFNLDNTTAFVTGVVQLCPCDTKNQLCPAGTDDTCNINVRKKTRALQGKDVINGGEPLFYNETCYCFDEDATVTQKSPRPTRRPTKKPTRRPTKRRKFVF